MQLNRLLQRGPGATGRPVAVSPAKPQLLFRVAQRYARTSPSRVQAAFSDDADDLDEFLLPSTSSSDIDENERSEAARKVMRHTDSTEIGSKYGEGTAMSHDQMSRHRNVSRPGEQYGLIFNFDRHRHVSRPDEQYGLIFNFDGVLAPIRAAYVRSWANLAKAKGIPVALSRHQQQALGLRNTSPERAMIDLLGWTRDLKVARALSTPLPGVQQWLTNLSTYNVPCALVSSLDRATVKAMLQRMNLQNYFSVMVTAEDDMETMSQRLLAASMQLHRPPKLCVAFEDNPPGITAAHNCTMKSIAVCNSYPAYQLKQADVTCGALDELAVYNIRRLFAQQGAEFMDVKQQQSGNKNRRHRPVAGGTI
eukprot:gene19750-26442_t